MKRKIKILFVALFAIMMLMVMSLAVSATYYEPDGTSSVEYLFPSSECNRTVVVSCVDTSGSLVKKVTYHTKTGEDDLISLSLYGYDIVAFSSNQSLLETCKITWTSGTGLCTSAYIQINYQFYTGLSKSQLEATVTVRKSESIQLVVNHYIQNIDPTNPNYKYYTKYDSASSTIDYYDYISTSKRTITGYHLKDGYESSISGKFSWTWVGKYKNMPSSPRCYSYKYVNTPLSEDMDDWSTYSESKHGKMDYCINRVCNIDYYYDLNTYTISFDANGGSGAPGSVTKIYGRDMTLPSDVPTRSGYTFKGWGTSSSSSVASYQPGGSYTVNSTKTLYAVWESNTPKTYTISYNANGGSGAPASQTKTQNVTLTLSSTKPTRSNYAFLGWSTSSTATSATYSPGASFTTNANTTLYAVWSYSPAKYTISYNANGGSGAPSSQTKTYGVTLTLSNTKPTRSNYTFLGWSTSSTATSATYSAGGSFSTNANTTLYAVWSYSPTTYTISYSANGGTGAPSAQTKTHGVTLILSVTKPTKTYYTFLGWSVSSTATVATYAAGGTFTTNANTMLYAVWEYTPPTYTISYNANGGSGAPASQTKTYGVSLVLSGVIPTRTNYTFLGWSTSSGAASATYSAGGSFTANADTTLYAVWKYTPPTYTVSFNANGGSGAPSSQTKTYGVALTLSSVVPTRNGYTFMGWGTSSKATTASYQPGSSYTGNGALTLYAIWEAIPPNTYTISYNANGGSGAPASQTKTEDVTLTLSSTQPTRTNYTFLGWAKSNTATGAEYLAGGIFTLNTSVTLYAVWTYTPTTYTISYSANGGSGAPSSQTKIYGEALTLSSTKPTRKNYTFLGWSACSTATSATYSAGGSYTVNASATLYAVWSYTPATYTVSFHANGGSGAPSDQTKTDDVTLILPATIPTRSQYTFLGWATNSTATSAAYSAGGSYTANASITLYAVWSYTPDTYTVSYHANGGTGAPASQTKTYGVTLTLSSVKPTRSQYTFLGWSTSSTATTATYSAGGSYTVNAGATLYAVWSYTPDTYTVSFNANGGTGAPASQIKTYGVTLTLSSVKPTMEGYDFLGWSTNSTATSATYTAGGSYTANAGATLYAVWRIKTYSVVYNGNGGSGVPASQTKTYGIALTLSSAKPTRSGYDFLGWSADSKATSATYVPGASYTANGAITLYAVWEKTNYDLSVTSISLSETESSKYGSVTVTSVVDSWDMKNAYSGISVELLYDGSVVSAKTINLSAYGRATLTFTLSVGSATGDHTVTVRINWADRSREVDSSNNSKSAVLTVKDYDYAQSVKQVTVDADYVAGNTVISSFIIYNDGTEDIVPDKHNRVHFRAYYFSGSAEVSVTSQDWEDFVIPTGKSNLVYFKWTVPTTLAGKTVYCECTTNYGGTLNEEDRTNNTVTFSKKIVTVADSQTPNTRYEADKPASYGGLSAPSVTAGSATWNQYVYENGAFVLKNYGIKVSTASPSVAPEGNCSTAVYESGKWTMKSGYGITVSYAPGISTLGGYSMPDSNAYTGAQSVVAAFPEFNYSLANGSCRTLQLVGGTYCFAPNSCAENSGRVHFIPVWFKDGNYVVSVTATQIWTPAGMITATRNANTVAINGTIYDDWYLGQK